MDTIDTLNGFKLHDSFRRKVSYSERYALLSWVGEDVTMISYLTGAKLNINGSFVTLDSALNAEPKSLPVQLIRWYGDALGFRGRDNDGRTRTGDIMLSEFANWSEDLDGIRIPESQLKLAARRFFDIKVKDGIGLWA